MTPEDIAQKIADINRRLDILNRGVDQHRSTAKPLPKPGAQVAQHEAAVELKQKTPRR